MTVQLPIILGPNGRLTQLPAGDSIAGGGGGGGSAGIGMPMFASLAEAQASDIPDTVNAIQLAGYNAPGDSGGGAYARVSSEPQTYVGSGSPTPCPPNLTSGGLPVLLFATTFTTHLSTSHGFGPTSKPIVAGDLVVIFLIDYGYLAGGASIDIDLPTFTDSAGNIYTLAKSATGGGDYGNGLEMPMAVYWCNPLFAAAPGTIFNIPSNAATQNVCLNVYQCPGFTGAVLDTSATATKLVHTTNQFGVSLASGPLTGSASLVFGCVHYHSTPAFNFGATNYTPPAGWNNLMPLQLNGRNPISCIGTTASSVTYNPTFDSPFDYTTTIIVAFKTFPRTSIDASYWALQPTFPVHTAQFGISPGTSASEAFGRFNVWLASIAPASGTSIGGISKGSASVTFSGAPGTPLVLTFDVPSDSEGQIGAAYALLPRFNNGMMISLAPIGSSAFPGFLVPGKRYFVQHGSVGLDGGANMHQSQTVRISETSIFVGNNSNTGVAGTPVLVPPGGIGVESGGLFSNGLTTTNPGSGYVDTGNAYWQDVSLIGGSGTGAKAWFHVTGGAVDRVLIMIYHGEGYKVGDHFTVSNSGLGGTGSGWTATVNAITHTYTKYAESWTDFVLDPGIYYSDLNDWTAPGTGAGLKKWRLYGSGARFQNAVFFQSVPWGDVNAVGTGSYAFQTQFETTISNDTNTFKDYIRLKAGNLALAVNYHINSWAILQCCELMGQNVLANWNNYTFEFAKIKDNNVINILAGSSFNNSTQRITLNLPTLGNINANSQYLIFAGSTVALFSMVGTGASALNGEWPVVSVSGTDPGPYVVVLQATGISGTPTITGGRLASGYITFYEQIQYNYRSTLPPFTGSVSGYSGVTGPATIVQMDDCFDQEVELHGLNIYGTEELQYVGLLSLRLIDCDIWGYGYKTGPFPSTMKKYVFERCRIHLSTSEIDKMIDTAHFIDCEFDWNTFLLISSASINKLVIDRCRLPGRVQATSIGGTPKNIVVRDSFLGSAFFFGTTYGVNESALLENSTITGIAINNQASQYTPLTLAGRSPDLSFVNGTLRMPPGFVGGLGTWNGPTTASRGPVGWSVPGGKIMIVPLGVGGNTRAALTGPVETFTVQDVYVGASPTAGTFCIDTDMAFLPSTDITITGTISGTTITVGSTPIAPTGALLIFGMVVTGTGLPPGTTITSDPPMPPITGSTFTISSSAGSGTVFHASVPMCFLPHPCPSLTVTNCSGGQFVSDMSGAPPQIPMWSYFRRAYGGGAIASPSFKLQSVTLVGRLVSFNVNVVKPYTGVPASTLTITMVGWDHTTAGNYYPVMVTQVINLKVAGSRTITAAGGTGLSGDTFNAVPFFLSGGHSLVLSANDGADNLAKYATFIITGRAMQNIEYSGLLTTTASGLEIFSDTVTQAIN